MGVRWGMFYANRLCEGPLQLGPEGVIRISFIHCIAPSFPLTTDHTVDEVHQIIDALAQVI
jgi:hypothetical protein